MAEDRRIAMVELQSVVAESHAAQLAFGAMGWCLLLCLILHVKVWLSALFDTNHLQYPPRWCQICRHSSIIERAEGGAR